MAESQQHKLDRVRRPRVHITYDVETGGAMKKVELPFVVGVLSDLSGQIGQDADDEGEFDLLHGAAGFDVVGDMDARSAHAVQFMLLTFSHGGSPKMRVSAADLAGRAKGTLLNELRFHFG